MGYGLYLSMHGVSRAKLPTYFVTPIPLLIVTTGPASVVAEF